MTSAVQSPTFNLTRDAAPSLADRYLPDGVQHGALPRCVLVAREEQRSVRTLQVRAALEIGITRSERPVRVKSNLSRPPHDLDGDCVELPLAVVAKIRRARELRIRTPIRRERNEAGGRLVDADSIIHSVVVRADIGEAEPHLLELLLDRHVVLVDLAIAGVQRVS